MSAADMDSLALGLAVLGLVVALAALIMSEPPEL